MTCRSQLLHCATHLRDETGEDKFTVAELTHRMEAEGTPYSPATIRGYIVSRMCVNATRAEFPKYNDFKHMGRGVYKFIFAGALP
jgi:hypothetical protein